MAGSKGVVRDTEEAEVWVVLRMSGVGLSSLGLRRDINEDAGFTGPTLLLVADGVGGAAAGEVASATTAYVVAGCALARPHDDPVSVLQDAVGLAQGQLARGVTEQAERQGMATTLTGVLGDGTRFALVHAGDSRGYVYRDDELIRVTRDDTLVQALIDEGRVREHDPALGRFKHIVTRTINSVDGAATVVPLRLREGDRILLSTDGLTDLVSEESIETVLRRMGDDEAVDRLVNSALLRGGVDNVTVVVGTVVDGPPLVRDGTALGALRDVRNVVDATTLPGAATG